ncbi:MAG: thioredoxin domain-containing protein [bacterium]
MKKYLIPGLFTLVIVAVIIFAVRAVSNTSNDSKPEDSQPPTVTLSDQDKKDLRVGQTTGPADAKVVLTEFSDMQCPACKFYETTIREIRAEYKDQVLFVFKHFPLAPSPHKNAQLAAIAIESAAVQGKFWEMHDLMYDKQEDWAEVDNPKDKYTEYAGQVGMNTDQFKKDYDSETGKDAIKRDKDFGTRLKLKGTPSFFIDGVDFKTTGDPGALKAAIKQAVEQAAK